ncbi:MAG TPA: hypothetical protein VGO55_02620 [Allosphingosinicella sp.]|jgi:hypothetical protein|nr:hypothetical protein [Allosphingosinicella sp.]
MIGRLAAFVVAIALPLTAGLAQQAPDPAALDLARILMTRDESLYGDADQGHARQQIQEALLAAPGGCNPYLEECQAAAVAVAREFAPNFRQGERARAERITAYLLADSLRPEEMARIAQYLRGPDGDKLLGALALLRQSERTERRRRELDRLVPRTGLGSLDAALARFRLVTRNTPRAPPR